MSLHTAGNKAVALGGGGRCGIQLAVCDVQNGLTFDPGMSLNVGSLLVGQIARIQWDDSPDKVSGTVSPVLSEEHCLLVNT